jgi:hypothetical protein
LVSARQASTSRAAFAELVRRRSSPSTSSTSRHRRRPHSHTCSGNGTRLVESPRALAQHARVILSVVTAASAYDAAKDLASDLTAIISLSI